MARFHIMQNSNIGISSRLVLLLAAAAGLSVASIYYAQPMLGALGQDMGASTSTIGLVPTLTQLGYAIGIIALAPMGDRFDRRRIILIKAVALLAALLTVAMAPTVGVLLAASLAIGLAATLAQDIVPAAATLAPVAHRGKIVGTVMTGLLLGILLSRVISGFVAEHWSWRGMFFIAAASVGLLTVALWRYLPRFVPTTQLAYGALLGSLWTLLRQHAPLRRAALSQGLLSVAFSAFWSTLAIMLADAPFHLGSTVAGLFGLAGAAGALAAPIAGRLADRRGPEIVTRLGTGLAMMAFAAMMFGPLLSTPVHLALLVAGAVVFDLGVQATLIAHQTIIYGLDAQARSRLNAVLLGSMFIGMAAGAALGSLLLAHWGWIGVTALSTIAALGALLTRLWPLRQGRLATDGDI